MIKTEKTAIYCRVSTKEQKDSGTSLDSQESRAWEYAAHKDHGYQVLDQLVVKEDWTGTDLDRPGLKKLLAEAERGSFDVLIVYTLDRLYRPKNEGEEWKVFEKLGTFSDLGVRVEFVDPTAT